jgi:hypothetical protein
MPEPTEFAGGWSGYSSMPLYDQALEETKAKQPEAWEQYQALYGANVPTQRDTPVSNGGGGGGAGGGANDGWAGGDVMGHTAYATAGDAMAAGDYWSAYRKDHQQWRDNQGIYAGGKGKQPGQSDTDYPGNPDLGIRSDQNQLEAMGMGGDNTTTTPDYNYPNIHEDEPIGTTTPVNDPQMGSGLDFLSTATPNTNVVSTADQGIPWLQGGSTTQGSYNPDPQMGSGLDFLNTYNPDEKKKIDMTTSQTTTPSNDQISYQYGEGDMSGLGDTTQYQTPIDKIITLQQTNPVMAELVTKGVVSIDDVPIQQVSPFGKTVGNMTYPVPDNELDIFSGGNPDAYLDSLKVNAGVDPIVQDSLANQVAAGMSKNLADVVKLTQGIQGGYGNPDENYTLEELTAGMNATQPYNNPLLDSKGYTPDVPPSVLGATPMQFNQSGVIDGLVNVDKTGISGLGGQAALDTTLIGENAPMPEIPLDAQIAAYNQLLLEQEAAKQAAIQAAIENTTTVYEPRPPVVTVTPPPVNTTPPPVSTTTLPWTPPVASPPPVVTVTPPPPPPPPPPPQEDEYETGNVGDSGASHGGTGFTYSTPITNSGVSYYGL